jgi:hypothetical protein
LYGEIYGNINNINLKSEVYSEAYLNAISVHENGNNKLISPGLALPKRTKALPD